MVALPLPCRMRDGVGVVEAMERRLRRARAARCRARAPCSSARATLETALHEIRDEIFLQPHVVGRVVPRHLRLDHPELGEVAARLRLLGAEGRTEGVDLPERRGRGLAVELARLREVRVAFVEVLGREQTASLADRRRENRRIDAQEAALVEEIVDRLFDLVADRRRSRAARLLRSQK